MRMLTSWLVAASRRWWLFGSIVVLNFVSLGVLFASKDRFEAIAGQPVFDTQNDLTVATLQQQLPRYTGAAKIAYGWFAAFDWIFPFVASLALAVLWAWLLRTNPSLLAQRLLRWNVPVWVFAVTLFDWLENISLLAIVFGGVQLSTVVHAALMWKQLKLAGLMASGAATVLLAGLAAFGWLYRIWHARMRRTETAQDQHLHIT